ncbi:MAG: Endolytic murein transglycosylase [Mycoplasmataceae bacterium]|nr:MAG: Endolytic murein transglycosylase [Mycoplasmataceae bacterium]
MNNSRPKYSFRGIEGKCNSGAFSNYINSKLDHWKMDIWQLGADVMNSEWNSLRPPLDCECRSREVESEQEFVFEFRYWYFVHALRCLKDDKQKIEEFSEPLLEILEKEGKSFWNEKETTWNQIEKKAQEVNYKIKEDDFSISKNSIMKCRNEAVLLEEEQEQMTYLNSFQNHKPSPQQIQQGQQKNQKRATQRQQKQDEQQQKEAEILEKVVEEIQKSGVENNISNNSSAPTNPQEESNKENNPSILSTNNPQQSNNNPSSSPKESPKEAIFPANKSEPIPKLLISLIFISVLITLGLLILFANKWVKKLLITQGFSSQFSKKKKSLLKLIINIL